MAGSGSSQNGGVPPGFRFHPTDEELLLYYLTKKVSLEKFDLDVIREVDLNKIEPWDLQERCRIGATPQNEWYFFSHKDRKYPTGSRTNRATNAGFWKATGRDKCIRTSYKKIGMRKTLVFYRGRAPHGQKTDWIMHEYRLEESDDDQGGGNEDGWVVCRVFKKKCFFKTGSSEASSSQGGAPDTLMYMNTSSNCLDHSRSLYIPQNFHSNLVHPQPITSLYRPELALHYSNQLASTDVAYLNNAQQIQVQDLLPNHSRTSPNGYEYHHPSSIVDNCELQIHKHGGEDGREMNANDWAIINEQNNVDGQMNQIVGQQQMRSAEMDLWGYGKD